MAKRAGKDVFILVDGFDLSTSKFKGFDKGPDNPVEDSTGFGDEWRERTPVGLRSFEVSLEGAYFDDATGRSHDAFSDEVPSNADEAARVLCIGFDGAAIGRLFDGFEGAYSVAYAPQHSVGALTRANVQHEIDGQHDEGVILQPLAAKTTDWDTESSSVDHASRPAKLEIPITSNTQANPTVVTTPVPHGLATGDVIVISDNSGSSPSINGEQTVTVIDDTSFSLDGVDTSAGSGGTGGTFVTASSQNGGFGYLQVTEFSGWDDITVKIRHSADDISYADLGTFAAVSSAPAAERLTVAAGTTVNRYLAMSATFGGTGPGSATVFVGFARA